MAEQIENFKTYQKKILVQKRLKSFLSKHNGIMNIFFLSWDLRECAKLYCDQHVNKILLEIVQMLYTAWHVLGEDDWNSTAPFKRNSDQRGYKSVSNKKHAIVMWVRSSRENYLWTAMLGLHLAYEFELRFKKTHSCLKHIIWLYENIPKGFVEVLNPNAYYSSTGFPKHLTPIPECMKEEYHQPNLLKANINNYINEKFLFAKWNKHY
jgi:hypothetical protein